MSMRRSFTAHTGGLPPKPPRRRVKTRAPLPPTVRLSRVQAEARARQIVPMPTACNACGEIRARHSLGCGTLAPGTSLVTGQVLEGPFPFRLGLCSECALKMLDAGELEVNLQRAPAPDPWPTGIGGAFDATHHDDEDDPPDEN